MNNDAVMIVGAGPAGLSAGFGLVKKGHAPLIIEKTDRIGGIARTEIYKDYLFDIGGHRFLTKIERIERLWHEIMGKDFIEVSRLSRIYYGDRFFYYPLRLSNVLSQLGAVESLLILASYLKANLRPDRHEDTFEQWISNRFGKRFYKKFFQTYTEKVWGIPCNKLHAEWASQRIKGLSFITALSNAMFGTQNGNSLTNRFFYPVRGPGMMWDRLKVAIETGGGTIQFNSALVRLKHENFRLLRADVLQNGQITKNPIDHLISSIPLPNLVRLFSPEAPAPVLDAADRLSYRAFVIVMLIVNKKHLFPDQWIYIHSPDVRVGRIQNFKNWSHAMVPDTGKTSIGMEYFCNKGDETWRMPDRQLAQLASRELERLGLANQADVIDHFVVRQPNAYPVYDGTYKENIDIIRGFIHQFKNLQTIGRSGMHRYNNMDHSMLTGLLSVENYLGKKHDLWSVNESKDYLE